MSEFVTSSVFRQTAKADSAAAGVLKIVKEFTTEAEVDDVSRRVKFIITTGDPDRENDTVDPAGWDVREYLRSPVVLWAHDYRSLPIAKAIDVTPVANGLSSTAQFPPKGLHPFADTVFELIKHGFIRAASVGFKPKLWSYNETRGGVDHLEQTLLEWSCVPVPANANALVAMSAAGIDTTVLKDWATRTLAFAVNKEPSDIVGALMHLDEAIEIHRGHLSGKIPTDDQSQRAMMRHMERAAIALDDDALGDEGDMSEHKAIRWNGKLSKAFDIADQEFPARGSRIESIERRDAAQLWDNTVASGSGIRKGHDRWDYFAETTQRGDSVRIFDRRDQQTRWNPQLSKAFDIADQEFPARSIEQDLVARHCGCQVKSLYHRHEPVYSTRMGAFLVALDETVAQMQVDDVRNLGSDGREEPPLYEHIQLNSTRSEEFLVDGLRFLTWNGVKLALRVEPRWYGLQVTAYGERKNADAARQALTKTIARSKEFNFLKGEAFSLSGEFLTRGSEKFDDVFLDQKNTDLAKRLIALINDKGAQLENRGVIMLGPPGNGKTLLGRILMNQTQSTFVWCSARDFWYSGGFRGLADAFEIGRESASAGTPAVLFVEDVDNYLDGHTTDLMKTEMDGIAQSKGVVTILTTNYPELLPKALIDRPGRFHDVVRFDLPDAATRVRMLAKWMPDLTGAALDETAKSLHGYSGAHVREFARFAGIIREQDGIDVVAAAKAALAKLQEQRDLITAVQVSGSRYRAPDHVQQKAFAGSDDNDPMAVVRTAGIADVPTIFSHDPVGWKAFVRARDRADKKHGGEVPDADLASLLRDYGFDAEAAVLLRNTEPMVHPGSNGMCPDGYAMGNDGMCHMPGKGQSVLVMRDVFDAVQKRGRVLSKANETKLQNAEAQVRAAAEQIRDVLATVAEMQPPDDDETAAVTLAADDAVAVIVDTDLGDEIVLELSDSDPAADDSVVLDADMVGDAIRAALAETVQQELTAALDRARGRVGS